MKVSELVKGGEYALKDGYSTRRVIVLEAAIYHRPSRHRDELRRGRVARHECCEQGVPVMQPRVSGLHPVKGDTKWDFEFIQPQMLIAPWNEWAAEETVRVAHQRAVWAANERTEAEMERLEQLLKPVLDERGMGVLMHNLLKKDWYHHNYSDEYVLAIATLLEALGGPK